MKAIRLIFILLTLVMGFYSCGQKTTDIQQNEQPEMTAPADSGNTQSESPSADAETSVGHDQTFLTQKILIYTHAFGPAGPDGEPPFKDEWIDLKPDGTFTAGKKKEETHSGRWGYNEARSTLVLKPYDTKKFPMSEWEVKHNDAAIVFVGTSRFGNNAYQCQLVWSETLPE